MTRSKGPKVLLFDIETAPIKAHVWQLWENNVALNQVECDWHLLSWAAKWLGDPPSKIMYADQRNAKDIENDKAILKKLWKLLDETDVVITQNGRAFDQKKVNARFIIHGFPPPSSYRHIDTKLLAQKHFKFTSNKLEYMTNKLCTRYKKLKHKRFAGHELWTECMDGNMAAWNEMEKYNKYDVLSLEELYTKLIPWDNGINFNVYHDGLANECKCGSAEFKKQGWFYTNAGKFQRYRCKGCGSESRSKENALTKEKVQSLRPGTPR